MKFKKKFDHISGAYNAVLPASIRYDVNFSDKQKLFYAELSAHMDIRGFCEKENGYFASILGVSIKTISRFVSEFNSRGYIDVEFDKGRQKRRISFPTRYVSFIQPPTLKEEEEDKTSDDYMYAVNFIKEWEKTLNCKVYAVDLYIKAILERLQSFSQEELTMAMKNRIDFVTNSEWHKEPQNKRYVTDITLLIRDDEKIADALKFQAQVAKKTLSQFNITVANKDLLN